tara:strand:+ start:63687 stop:64145 length:459 start_codon:yes stop_codon:yes gene_type:complete
MKYLGIVLLAITATVWGVNQNFADSGTPCSTHANGACGSSNNGCSQGCKTCRLHMETLKVKKYCFNIECKDICIPPVRFPWQKCCELKCGKIKTVRVLKKHEYTCEKCGYKWTVENLCGDCNSGKCETTAPQPVQSANSQPPLAPATSIRKR